MRNRVAEVMLGTMDKGKGRASEVGALEHLVGPGELLSLWSIVADVCPFGNVYSPSVPQFLTSMVAPCSLTTPVFATKSRRELSSSAFTVVLDRCVVFPRACLS